MKNNRIVTDNFTSLNLYNILFLQDGDGTINRQNGVTLTPI